MTTATANGNGQVPQTLFGALAAFQANLPKIAKGETAQVPTKQGGSYCVAPETKVLTHDLRWVEAQKLAVGDRLIGFDEMPQPEVRCRRWRSAEVQATKWVTLPSYRIHLADGTKIVASATHRWLVMNGNQAMTWMDTQDLRTPDRKRAVTSQSSHLVRAVDMWPEELTYETGYLAAAFDGEGCLVQTPINRAAGLTPRDQTYQLHCVFSQRDNEMRRKVDGLLAHFGFAVQNGRPGGTNGDVHPLRIAGGRPEVLRFLGQIRPDRLLSGFTADHLGTFRSKERVAVTAIEFLGEQPVIAMQTSTRTFIAEGFASHNSYKYADLTDISEVVMPRLGTLGLAFIARPTTREDGKFGLAYSLVHVSGEREDGFYELNIHGMTPQQIGGLITYARRYCLCAATGTAPGGDDDDAASAQQYAAGRQSAGDVFENATPAPARQNGGGGNSHQRGQVSRPAQAHAQGKPADAEAGEADPDAQAYAEEAYQALTLATLEDIQRRAREAGKLTALVLNPSSSASGQPGKLAIYLDWKRKQVKELDDAMSALMTAAKETGFPVNDIEAHVKSVTGTDLDAATAAQIRHATQTLRVMQESAA